jgi:hypothetical protein
MNIAERRRLLRGPPDDDQHKCVDCGAPAPLTLCADCAPGHVCRWRAVRRFGGARYWECRCGDTDHEIEVNRLTAAAFRYLEVSP